MIKNYINCEPIQSSNSMAILTEQFLEIKKVVFAKCSIIIDHKSI